MDRNVSYIFSKSQHHFWSIITRSIKTSKSHKESRKVHYMTDQIEMIDFSHVFREKHKRPAGG